MEQVYYSLLYIVSLIGTGWILRRFIRENFWNKLNSAFYYYVIPAGTLLLVSHTDWSLPSVMEIIVAIIGCTLILVFISFALKNLGIVNSTDFTTIFQTMIRPSWLIVFWVIPLITSKESIQWIAVIIGIWAPISRLVTIWCMTKYATPTGKAHNLSLKKDKKHELKFIFKTTLNIHFLSLIGGIILNIMDISASTEVINLYLQSISPIVFILVGTALQVKSITNMKNDKNTTPLVLALFLKLIISPILYFIILNSMGLSKESVITGLVIGMLPASAGACTISRQFKANNKLMAQIVTLGYILSLITIPAVVYIYILFYK